MLETSPDTAEEPTFVELWNEEQVQAWQEYHLSGMAELISSANLCQALLALNESGLLARLQQSPWLHRDELLVGCEARRAIGFLRYLAVCGVLDEWEDAYRLSRRGTMLTNPVALARLNFYTRAYAPVLTNLGGLLTGGLTYGTDVTRDDAALSRSTGTVTTTSYSAVILDLVRRHSARRLLDLGCGSGALVVDVCTRCADMAGVGIDIAPAAIEEATRRAHEHTVDGRVTFAVANAFRPSAWPDVCSEADLITGVGVLHELFRDGEEAVIGVLDEYAEVLAGGRTLLIGEPELRYDDKENDSDFYLVHVLTGQGIPRCRADWLDVFAKSALVCRRVYANAVAGPRTCFYELTPREG